MENIADSLQIVGIGTGYPKNAKEENIEKGRSMAQDVLRKFTYDTFLSIAHQTDFREEITDCDGGCVDTDIEHPHKLMYIYMDIDVEQLKVDLQKFVDRKLAPFKETL